MKTLTRDEAIAFLKLYNYTDRLYLYLDEKLTDMVDTEHFLECPSEYIEDCYFVGVVVPDIKRYRDGSCHLVSNFNHAVPLDIEDES